MSSPPMSTAEDHNAGRRAREVYRYFRPERLSSINEHTSPSIGDEVSIQDPNSRGRSPCTSVQSSVPLQIPTDSAAASPMSPMPESLILGDANVTLNSFAQLAALRLDVDRVFISVSDRDSQFIIAQAGQTSAGTDKYDFLSDGLYTGCSSLDVGTWTMCKDTVALPASNRGSGDYNFVVSNDMLNDERYRDLPLVQKDPSFRFYAGTPLTTDSSINVGCFFVLDTKPHPEFSKDERDSMGHMAMLIMDFLKVSRQASEGRRAARLSRGMNYFVEGRSNFPSPKDVKEPSSRPTSNDSGSRRKARHRKNRSISSRSSHSSSSCASDSDQSTSSRNTKTSKSGSDLRHGEIDMRTGNSRTFRRAANLIRESLELGGNSGVVFVEAGSEPMLDRGSDSESSSVSETEKTATILALSTAERLYGPEDAPTAPYPVTAMNEGFLHRLLNTYDQGKIWSLHRDGQLYSSDSESSSDRLHSRRDSTRSKNPKKWRVKENIMLNKYFPGATQLIFVPLWNAANSQWFGGFFCWNNVESDVFSQSVDLSSLRSFGSSIMVECSRVESIISDRQKADFLGSISHELRSPLHGILAAAEILQTTTMDQYQGSLMDTINACGRTLLDTMNQVLDYSKILSLEKRFRHLDRRRTTSLELKNMHRAAAHLDTFSAIDLSILAEEVVDGVCIGHYHNQVFSSSSDVLTSLENNNGISGSNLKPLHPRVDVSINISPNDWVYHIPPGALRRIIMNIFSNALKYTDAGHVAFRLEVESSGSQHTTQEDIIVLTVSDTGRGISEEFLRSKLFVPFVQEDSLAMGSGLGLSIVRSLIKSLGGRIDVQSHLGKGTTVKVTLPLVRPEKEQDAHFSTPASPSTEIRERPTSPNEARRLRQTHSGRTVAIVNSELTDMSEDQSWSSVSHYLTNWFGLNVVPFSPKTPVDLILIDGTPSDDIINTKLPANTSVLLCSKEYIGQGANAGCPSQTQNFDIINQPWGPHKLARFVKKCLNDRQPFDNSRALTLDPEPTPRFEKFEPQFPVEDQSTETSSSNSIEETDSSSATSVSQETTQTSESESSLSIGSPSPPPELQGPRVLVVEDNKINLNLMLAFLKKRVLGGLDSAENGRLAVEAVQNENRGYDIIFMDISMPVMNGFDAARAIRTFEKGREDGVEASTIIALTGLSSIVDEAEALDAGMDLFLTKPVAFKEVNKILDRWEEDSSSEMNGGTCDSES